MGQRGEESDDTEELEKRKARSRRRKENMGCGRITSKTLREFQEV